MRSTYTFISERPNEKKPQPEERDPRIKINRRKRTSTKPAPEDGSAVGIEGYCFTCGIVSSPQWRKGPAGSKSLCNACGLHYQNMIRDEKKIPVVPTPQRIRITDLLNPEVDDSANVLPDNSSPPSSPQSDDTIPNSPSPEHDPQQHP